MALSDNGKKPGPANSSSGRRRREDIGSWGPSEYELRQDASLFRQKYDQMIGNEENHEAVGKRLLQLRRAHGYTQIRAAAFVGCGQRTILAWEKARSRPKTLDLFYFYVEQALGGNVHWVVTGEGEMLKKTKSPSARKTSIASSANIPDKLPDIKTSIKQIPLYSIDGNPDHAFNMEEDTLEPSYLANVDNPKVFASIITDKSMAPDFMPGDLVIFLPKPINRPGTAVFYGLKDGTSGFGKLGFEGDTQLIFKPTSTSYDDVVIDEDKIDILAPVYSVTRFPGKTFLYPDLGIPSPKGTVTELTKKEFDKSFGKTLKDREETAFGPVPTIPNCTIMTVDELRDMGTKENLEHLSNDQPETSPDKDTAMTKNSSNANPCEPE